MPTPRKRYFRMEDSIAREPWDNDLVATYTRLSAYFNNQWARDGLTARQAARAVFNKQQLKAITGKGRADIALKSLRYLAEVAEISARYRGEVAPISIESRGDIVEIHWPNWPIFQGLVAEPGVGLENDRSRAQPPPRPASRVPRPAEEEEQELREEKSAISPPARRPIEPEWLDFASRFAEAVKEQHPSARVPGTNGGIEKWARELRALKRPIEEVEETCAWIFSDRNQLADTPFVVHSPQSLLKRGCDKYTRVRAVMARGSRGPKVLQAARKALDLLEAHDPPGKEIPRA